MDAKMQILRREYFTRKDLDPHHYYYSFAIPGFEICLEPCAAGFDVCIYANSYPTEFPELQGEKICTETGDYTTSIEGLFGDRSDEDWNKALAIADELLEKHIKNPEKLREILSHLPDDKGNALITEDEITALKARAKRITMQDALRETMEGGVLLVIPMDLKSGYCVSYTIIEKQPGGQLEIFSVGAHGDPVDPADAELLAKAVLHEYNVLGNLLNKGMTHFMKKVKT